MIYMRSDSYLCHHGVKGQRWGIRRTPAQLGHAIKKKVKKFEKNVTKVRKNVTKKVSKQTTEIGKKIADSKKKTVDEKAERKKKTEETTESLDIKKMSTIDLQAHYKRLKLENDYRAELAKSKPKKIFDGKAFVTDVVNTTGKDLAKDVTKHVAGKMINNMFDAEVVKVAQNNKKPEKADKKEDDPNVILDKLINACEKNRKKDKKTKNNSDKDKK